MTGPEDLEPDEPTQQPQQSQQSQQSQDMDPDDLEPFIEGNPPIHKLPHARVGVIERVYHQRSNANPTAVEHRFGWHAWSPEGVYERTTEIKTDWQPLDVGWYREGLDGI